MSSVDDALENVVWAAADEFLSENLDEILDEVFERVYEEDTDDLEGIVEEVVSEWLSRSYVYDQIQTYIDEQIDDECMYSDDCMDIITDYGFSDSLAAAQEMGVWPAGTQAVEHGRRTCGGCDLSDVSECATFAKVRLSIFRDLFVFMSIVLSLIFCDFGCLGHFRTARSGVYIVEE